MVYIEDLLRNGLHPTSFLSNLIHKEECLSVCLSVCSLYISTPYEIAAFGSIKEVPGGAKVT